MKKKLLVTLFVITATICNALGFTACGEHKHSYTDNVVPSTCTEQGYTLHTCDCGESYKDTFVKASHTFDREEATEEYFKEEATCTIKPLYYVSCSVCGEKSSEVFQYGVTKEHTYEEIPSMEDYLISGPTCTQKGVFYKSCSVCGKTGTETFEYLDAIGHTFNKQTITEEYLMSEATCKQRALYYFSCLRCDEKGAEFFEYGEFGSHSYENGICTVCKGVEPLND